MRRQLVLMAVAITSIVVLAFVIPLAVLVRSTASNRAITEATTTAQSLTGALLASADTVDTAELTRVVDNVDQGYAGAVAVYLPDDRMLGNLDHPVTPEALVVARGGRAFEIHVTGGVDVLVPVATDHSPQTVVVVFVPTRLLEEGVRSAWLVLGSLALALIFLSAFVSDRIARSLTRPLRDAASVAERLAAGDLAARIDPEGTEEVTAVANALNLLADRIGGLLQEERESVADLSHRLRTPVTALRLATEQLTDPLERARLVAELDRLDEALNAMIRQARVPITHDLGADLVGAVRDRMAFWTVLGQAQNRPVTLDLRSENAPVNASRHDLDSVVDALVGNVFHHTPPGGRCSVVVERTGDWARLIVDDAGPGLPNADVTVRGRRGPRSRGTGLGLDIVSKVAERSGGNIQLGRSPLGGARVCVVLGGATSKVS